MDLKIGILGFGGMGHYHAEHVKVDGVKFISACDIEQIQLDDADEFNLKTFLNDEEAFFADPDINTVLLTVPNHLHKEYAIKAARAKKNIICEKPAALNVAEFDEMVAVAKEEGVLFSVHQNRRWDKDYKIVKKIYDEEMIGRIFNFESTLQSPNGRIHGWHGFKKYGGGMVYDWAVHLIDQALNMIDCEIETIYADLKSIFNTEVDDYYKIIIKFKNDVSFVISHCTYSLKPLPRWMVYGDKGTTVINSFEADGNIYKTTEFVDKLPPRIPLNVAGPTRSFRPVPPGKLITEDLPQVETSWLDYYKNYLEVLNSTAEFFVTVPQVRRVLAVIESVFESDETNTAVPFVYDTINE